MQAVCVGLEGVGRSLLFFFFCSYPFPLPAASLSTRTAPFTSTINSYKPFKTHHLVCNYLLSNKALSVTLTYDTEHYPDYWIPSFCSVFFFESTHPTRPPANQ